MSLQVRGRKKEEGRRKKEEGRRRREGGIEKWWFVYEYLVRSEHYGQTKIFLGYCLLVVLEILPVYLRCLLHGLRDINYVTGGEREEGRGKREEGRGKREEGRRERGEGRREGRISWCTVYIEDL
jgi:hypothetical protein